MLHAVLAAGFVCLVAAAPVSLDETGNVCAGPPGRTEVPAGPFSPVLEWTAKAVAPTARNGLGAAVLGDSVYAVGGYGNAGRLSENEVYNAVSNTWTTRASMPTPRNGCCATAAAGKVYVIAGYNGNYLDVVEEYSPATNTWATKAPLAIGRTTPTAVTLDGKMYVMGGFTGSVYPRTVERFDPGTGTWDTVAPMPTGRTAPAACVHAGKIYVIDGWTGSEPPLNVVEVYDPGTNSWSSGTPAPTQRWFLTAAAMDSWVFACGGALSFSGNYTNLVEAYNPATGQWSSPAPLPVYAKGPAAGVVRGKSYVVGGFNGTYLADNSEGRLTTTALAEPGQRVPWGAFRITPNPLPTGFAVLRVQGFKGSRVQGANVRVFDALGRCVLGMQCLQTLRNEGVVALQIDCRKLSSGVYLVRLDADGSTAMQKFVVQRNNGRN